MKKILGLLLVATGLLTGCQSIGEHFNCWAEVDRTVPAQTQQKYLRTDTKCSSSGGGIATPTTTRGGQYIVNTSGETNCTSTPIYETIILNQAQRNTAYEQCRVRINSQRQSSNSSLLRAGDVMSMNDAKAICTKNGLQDGTGQHTSCVLRTVTGR